MGKHDDLLYELDRHPGLEVGIRAGGISLTVNGDGEVEVLEQSGGRTNRFRRHLDPARIRQVGGDLAGVEDLAPLVGDAQPDSAPIVIELARDGKLLHRRVMWSAHRARDPRLHRLLRSYEELVGELTGGRLPHGEG